MCQPADLSRWHSATAAHTETGITHDVLHTRLNILQIAKYLTYMLHDTCNMLQATDYRLHTTHYTLQATDYMLQTCAMNSTCYMLQDTCHMLLQNVHYEQRTTCYRMHATYDRMYTCYVIQLCITYYIPRATARTYCV